MLHLLAEAGLLVLASAVPLALVIAFRRRSSRRRPALLFLALLFVDAVLTGLPQVVEVLQVPGVDRNWTGKALSLAFGLLAIRLSEFSWFRAGVTRKQRVGAMPGAVLITALLTVAGGALGWLLADDIPLSAETLAFQLTMPGLAEEVVYRGLLLAMLHRALPARLNTPSWWWPAVLTALTFGLWHGLALDDAFRPTFDALAFALPFLGGLAYAWLRDLTGSLLFPILAHNLGNTAYVLLATLGG